MDTGRLFCKISNFKIANKVLFSGQIRHLSRAACNKSGFETKDYNNKKKIKTNVESYMKISKRYLHFSKPLFAGRKYFTQDHEWINVKDGIGVVGITDHAQDQLGDIVYCELPNVGDEVTKGDSMAVIESVKAASDLYAPVSGEVTEVNTELSTTPKLINESPTDQGWLLKIKLSDESDLQDLMSENEYTEFAEES